MNAQGLSKVRLYGSNPYSSSSPVKFRWLVIAGRLTDAAGNPIASFGQAQAAHDAWAAAVNPAPAQGTTLNSAPQLMVWRRRATRSIRRQGQMRYGEPGSSYART